MRLTSLLLLFAVLARIETYRPEPPHLFVWNTGQGQWLTLAAGKTCQHVDMGGQKAPWNKIRSLCAHRKNQLWITHWDKDHYGHIDRFLNRVDRNLCLAGGPSLPFLLPRKYRLPKCLKNTKDSQIQTLFKPDKKDPLRSKNDRSYVYLIKGQILVPGDATRGSEQRWASKVKGLPLTLIVGHHGSKTSSSTWLLKNLERTHQAIISARKKTYGHPHPQVLKRLRRHHLAPLVTESWGSIAIELSPTARGDIPYSNLVRQAHRPHSRHRR